jgi:signal transduction histidine kinase
MNILSNAIDALEEARETDSILEEQTGNGCVNTSTSVPQVAPQKPTIRILTEVQDDNTVLIRIVDNGPWNTASDATTNI